MDNQNNPGGNSPDSGQGGQTPPVADQPAGATPQETKCVTCGNSASGGTCTACGQGEISCSCTPAGGAPTGGMSGGTPGGEQPTGAPAM